MTKCTDNYLFFNLNYVAEGEDKPLPPNPDPPVEPKRENFNSDAEYQAALAKYRADFATYKENWGSTPPSTPNPPPNPANYTNQAQYAQDYAAWRQKNQGQQQADWGDKVAGWTKNKNPDIKENLFVERADQYKNEIFDLDPKAKREIGTAYASALEYHFDDDSGLFTMDPSTEQTDRQRECTASFAGHSGKLVGIGPSCSEGDKGNGEYHDCYFSETKECWVAFQLCATDLGLPNKVQGKNSSRLALPIARKNNIEGCKEAHKKCMKQAKKLCACEDCMYDSCMYGCGNNAGLGLSSTTTTTTNTDSNKNTVTTNTIPGITSVAFTSSQYYIPQPLIYGRYIVSGNIIWAGNIESKVVSETTTDNNGSTVTTTTTNSTQVHGAFAVAVGAGPLTGVLRVWLGTTLLFNKLLETDASGNVVPTADGTILDEIENTVLFSNNSSDKKFYDASKMKLTFFNGDEDQLPAEAMGGNAPAYRGVAFILFENFNLSYVGGRLPEVKVEVVSAQSEVVPKLSTPTDIGLDPHNWVVDKLASVIYASDGAVFHRYAYDTLKYLDSIDPVNDLDIPFAIAQDSLTVIPDGLVVLQQNFASYNTYPIHVIDPDSKQVLATGGQPYNNPVAQLFDYRFDDAIPKLSGGNYAKGYAGYRLVSGPTNNNTVVDAFYTVAVDKDGYGVITSFDQPTRSLIVPAMSLYPFQESGTTPRVFGTSIIRENYTLPDPAWKDGKPVVRDNLFVFSVNVGASQPEIMIVRAPLMDSGRAFNAYSPHFMSESNRTQLTVPAQAWGGMNTGLTGAFVIDDVTRDSVILFLRSNTGNDVIVSVKAPNMTVNWAVNYRGVPTSRCHMDSTPADTYSFIDSHDKIVTLSLKDGGITVGATTASLGLSNCDGDQFYDPLRATITYAHGGGLRRLFLSRALGNNLSFADMARDLCGRVDVPITDVSLVKDIPIDGYIIDGNTKPRDALLQLMKIYGVVAYEEGNGLKFAPKQESAPVATLTYDNIDATGYSITLQDTFKQPASFKFSYANINNFCKPTSQTVQQAVRKANSALDDVVSESYTAPIVFSDDTRGKAAAERMYAASQLATNFASANVGAALLPATVGDRVQVELPDGTVRINRIASISLNPNSLHASFELADDLGYLNDYLPVVLTDSGDLTAQTTFTRYVNMRPRAFFLPAFTPEDQRRAGTDSAVFYVGVHKNSARPFTTTRVDYSMLTLDTTFKDGGTVTRELATGQTADGYALAQNMSPGVPDYTSVLRIKFDRPAVTTPGSTPVETAIGDGQLNLLVVGKEIVQFLNAAILPDGRTVEFTGFIRGRFGTEIHMDYHSLDEEALQIVPGSLAPVYVPLGVAAKNSPVALKLASWTAVDQLRRVAVFPWDDVSFQPYAPTHLNRFDAPNGDVLLTWDRRSLYDGEMKDATDTVPLSPDVNTYNAYVKTIPSNAPFPYDDTFLVFIGPYNLGTPEDIDRRIQEALRNGSGSGFVMRAIVRGDQTYIKKSTFDSFKIDPKQQLNVAVVKLGGPAMLTPGKPAVRMFQAGEVFPPIPPQYSATARTMTSYATITPGRLTLQATNRYLVLRPV